MKFRTSQLVGMFNILFVRSLKLVTEPLWSCSFIAFSFLFHEHFINKINDDDDDDDVDNDNTSILDHIKVVRKNQITVRWVQLPNVPVHLPV